jgi:hypothetical protein
MDWVQPAGLVAAAAATSTPGSSSRTRRLHRLPRLRRASPQPATQLALLGGNPYMNRGWGSCHGVGALRADGMRRRRSGWSRFGAVVNASISESAGEPSNAGSSRSLRRRTRSNNLGSLDVDGEGLQRNKRRRMNWTHMVSVFFQAPFQLGFW